MLPPRDSRPKQVLRLLLATLMVSAGVLHFTRPDGFIRIVPSLLPAPRLLVLISGAFEIIGGLGLLHRDTRHAASLELIALLVAVFPANINMAANDIQPVGDHVPTFLLWLRLPLQAVLVLWAWWVGRREAHSGAA